MIFNIEVLLGILVFIGNTYLGVLVFLRNPKSWTNRFYILLAILIDAYVVTNFISLHPELINSTDQLFWIRVVMFVCSFIGPVLLFLVHTFPGERFTMPMGYTASILLLMYSSAAFSLLPLVFTDLQYINGQPVPTPGPGIPIFFIDFIGLFVTSFIVLGIKFKRATGVVRDQLRTISYGVMASFSLMGISTVIFVVILKSSSFVFLGPIYTLLLMATIAYAIIRYNLFNIKMIATQTFVAIISTIFLARIFVSRSLSDRTVDLIIFLATISFGYLLIRSIKMEIKGRDEIHQLAKRLTETNWQLARTNEQLRIIDQRKSEFVSIVSHQLRTPITAIKGYSSLLLEDSFGKLPAVAIAPIEKIFVSSKRLADMVADFLDISKIEQGTMVYNFASVDVGAMLTELAEEFMVEAEKKKLALHLHIPKKELFIVTADSGKIRQVLSNILDNSLKYTPKGEVNVFLERDNVHGVVLVKIKDTGIGLSSDDIHHLFGKFTRGTGGQKENTDGSGLGLYVAKKMLEAHRGNIWVDSEGPGKGSTFVIQLLAEEQ